MPFLLSELQQLIRVAVAQYTVGKVEVKQGGQETAEQYTMAITTKVTK
jgi:hypothetical protein